MKIGIQVSSLKPLLLTGEQVDFAFSKFSEMGVDTVQLQWIDPEVSPAQIAASLARHRIESVGVQDFSTAVLQNRGYYYELNHLTQGPWLCPSRIPGDLEPYAQALEQIRDELAPLGQKLCFHPVAADFDRLEQLLERLKWLDVCLDLYHVHKAGLSIPDFLRRWQGRICMVHFKDYRRLADGTEVLVPAGRGDIDWTGAVEACLETGVSYAFVEQERWEGDPFERLNEALIWLREQAF